jgi:acetate---CoA ligase (ADP-forming)
MLEHLFSPESVAVVGASKTPGKVGHDILVNLVKGGFTGKIIPINPSGGTMMGLPVSHNLSEYDGDLDQVIVAVPKSAVIATVKEALAKKAKSIIMITAGFKESGSAGQALETEVIGLCKREHVFWGRTALVCSTLKII